MPEPKKNREDYLSVNDTENFTEEFSDEHKFYDPTPKNLSEHLEEIRNRLIIVSLILSIIFFLSFSYSEFLIKLLEKQAPNGSSFFQLKPGELLFSSFKIAAFTSLIFSSPVISLQLFSFLKPGLKQNEYKIIKIISYSVPVLLFSGVLFAYYCILPPLLSFLLGFNSEVIESRYGIEHFINLCISILMISGVCFQIPVLIITLAACKLITVKQLLAAWRYVTVLAFTGAALLTPTPDPFTMSILALAILGLYFGTALSISLFKL